MTGLAAPVAEMTDGSLLYVAEFQHRVHNEYMKVISFASEIARRTVNPEAKAALHEVIEQICAIAKIHHALRPPFPGEYADFGQQVTDLCKGVMSTGLEQQGIALKLTISGSTKLDAIRCWCASLIVAELISNACRHAFKTSGGKIFIQVKEVGYSIECTIQDNGSAAENSKSGVGTQLVNRLAEDLGAHVGRCFKKSGSRVTLRFPIAAIP